MTLTESIDIGYDLTRVLARKWAKKLAMAIRNSEHFWSYDGKKKEQLGKTNVDSINGM